MLNLSGSSILVVEDDTDSLALITLILQTEMGAKVTAVEDGQQALDAIEAELFDFALIDLALPIFDGWRLIKQVRHHSNENLRHLYCIALTAYAMPGDREKALELGYNEYITKPIDFLTIDAELRRALQYCSWYQRFVQE
jgi:CheY-like chemotaxis protein